MPTIPQRMQQAVAHHQAGRLAEAEAIYRAVMQDEPRHPHALHLLGVIAHQAGRHREALDLIGRALAAGGPHPVFHSNLSAVYLVLRPSTRPSPTPARPSPQPGLRRRPQQPRRRPARAGRLAEAETAFRAALLFNPGHVDARSNLGAALHRQGQLPEALTVLREAVRLAPLHAQAHNDLGGVLLARGDTEEAPATSRALRLDPTWPTRTTTSAWPCATSSRIDEAMGHFREAIPRLKPDSPTAHNNIGFTLEDRKGSPTTRWPSSRRPSAWSRITRWPCSPSASCPCRPLPLHRRGTPPHWRRWQRARPARPTTARASTSPSPG